MKTKYSFKPYPQRPCGLNRLGYFSPISSFGGKVNLSISLSMLPNLKGPKGFLEVTPAQHFQKQDVKQQHRPLHNEAK